jgi:pimeloyl-ACP methyl ester carboxylesterase
MADITGRYQYNDRCTLAYADIGPRDGYPILVQHGLIASINDGYLFDFLIKSGIRIISTARPGYGDSTPYPMRNIAEWGDIVTVLVEKLKIRRFDVLGISSGAPYSYAIGKGLPDKVGNIFIFSGTPALFDEEVIASWPYPINRDSDIPELERSAKDLFFSAMSIETSLQNDIIDSMRNNCFGIALDFKIRAKDWGFQLSDLPERVYMQHSRTDSQVPLATAELTARMLSNCQMDVRENGDHFSEELLNYFLKSTVLPNCGMADRI